ncbi:zinc finger protein 692 [Ornithorhynchus anatinus]|uniref:zinc finger protein 692 n=1 Tax=Ornithorhynchus anatinus TaxID=9258 RepID=UPI0019D460DC|nr:zinc finger protein 692 [Ornithorhynchus anatinus]
MSRRGAAPTPGDPAGDAGGAAEPARRRTSRRREPDARRGRCRIRLGGHMERWCLLKDRLGFALHSQLARFLLDRYSSPGCALCTGLEPPPPPPEGLQALVLLSHAHSRTCGLVPGLREPGGPAGGLVWECPAGHSFSWTPAPGGAARPRPRGDRRGAASPEESQDGTREPGTSSGEGARPGREEEGEDDEDEEDGEEEEEEEEGGDPAEDVNPWAHGPSPEGEPAAPRSPSPARPPARPGPAEAAPPVEAAPEAPGPPEGEGARADPDAAPRPARDGGARASRRPRASPRPPAHDDDDDVAQIGPKRIRKAAKRELLPCDFPGCGKIFSNRQYLNHHRKYQHDHQKSFSCPEPACRKSFDFKKHLKEHVKLHSDTRDYICEFCARPFRTSSNLAIHRRIHTGEKPLQCEICGFTCRQKASLNWHRRRHEEAAAAFRFPCELCGKRFEKPDNVAAHRSKSHPDPRPAPAVERGPGP